MIRVDVISFKLSHAATLTSVGLFGTKNTDYIPVGISVGDNQSDIFTSSTSYKSTGTKDPIRVPVNVKMVADTEYTINVVIGSRDTKTYFGQESKSEVNCGGKLIVVFEGSSQLTGQIPTLGFHI